LSQGACSFFLGGSAFALSLDAAGGAALGGGAAAAGALVVAAALALAAPAFGSSSQPSEKVAAPTNISAKRIVLTRRA
jgi:hypothetical protein